MDSERCGHSSDCRSKHLRSRPKDYGGSTCRDTRRSNVTATPRDPRSKGNAQLEHHLQYGWTAIRLVVRQTLWLAPKSLRAYRLHCVAQLRLDRRSKFLVRRLGK